MEDKKLWFKRKWYGWGWYPATWQGLLITCAYVILMIFFAAMIDASATPREFVLIFLLPAILLTIIFLKICYKKGETPRWQWGRPKDTDPEN